METLKDKIEWMLNGEYLTDKASTGKRMFYSISIRAVKAKNPKRNYYDQHLPMENIDENMKILCLVKEMEE